MNIQKLPNYARYFGLALDAEGRPNAQDVTRAAQARVVIQINLR